MIGVIYQLSDYVWNYQELLHDSSAVTWPTARVVSRINDARLDCSLDMQCVRTLVTGVQLIPGQEAYNISGAVCGATITSGGSNYGAGTTVPITFSAAPMGGITATATGVLTGGGLTAINMTPWGQGYLTAPTIAPGRVCRGRCAAPAA